MNITSAKGPETSTRLLTVIEVAASPKICDLADGYSGR
jgi:hypothetical protein